MPLPSWFTLCAAALLCGCGAPRLSSRSVARYSPPEPYLRISSTQSNVLQLQIAVRRFVPAAKKGPSVCLVAVSHLGESDYYATLQRLLDAHSLVLFEGVSGPGPRSGLSPLAADSAAATTRTAQTSSLQQSLAASLGLVFQLQAIDYHRPNFRHCDLSIAQLRQLLAEQKTPPGPAAAESFESLVQLMQGGSWLDSLLQVALRFLQSSPKLQALGRLVLIDTLGQIQGDPSHWRDLPPNLKQLLQVLLQRRNQKVIAELKSELPRLGRRGSVAVFYGTAHMPDLEQRLRQELNFAPADQAWLTAFSVDLHRAGVTDAERQFIHQLVKSQLR